MVGDTTYIPEITWLEIPRTHLRSHGWRYHVHTLDHMVEIPRTLESITYFAHWMNVWCSSICLSRPFCKLSVLVSRGACRTVKGLEYQYSNTIEPTKVVFKIMVFYMWHIRCNKNMFQLLWYDSLNNSFKKYLGQWFKKCVGNYIICLIQCVLMYCCLVQRPRTSCLSHFR